MTTPSSPVLLFSHEAVMVGRTTANEDGLISSRLRAGCETDAQPQQDATPRNAMKFLNENQ